MSNLEKEKPMTMDRRFFLGASASLVPLALTACQTAVSGKDPFSSVDAAANSMVSDGFTPGLGLSVMRDGEFIYSKAFGHANIETSAKLTTQSIFKIASITKQMTAAAILLLQEDGKLSVGDRLSDYIPEFPRAEEITLYQLATHTAGLGSFNRLPSRGLDRLQEYDDEAYLELMMRTDPMFVGEPGAEEIYSNTDYGLLGLIIGRVSGMHYSEFFQTRLFYPLGLENTQLDNALEVVEHRVSGYSPNATEPSGYQKGGYTSVTYPGPSGGVISTSEDLCLWHKGLVFGSLLKAESLQQMLAPVVLPDTISYYGMGVRSKFSRDPFKDRNVVSHGGRIYGFATDLWSFPEKGVTVATLLNSDGGDRDQFGKRFDSVRDPATQIALNEQRA